MDYGFPTNSTRIQILTEFYGGVQPDRVIRPIRIERSQKVRNNMVTPDLVDEMLGFGKLVFPTGRAFSGISSSPGVHGAAPVVKQFLNISGRDFLVESVEYPSIKPELDKLPDPSLASAVPRRKVHKSKNAYAVIPAPSKGLGQRQGLANKNNNATRISLRSADPKRPGVTVDYLANIGGSLTGTIVFQGDMNYFVSGPVYCNGPVVLEGGTTFKFPNATGQDANGAQTTAFILLNSSLTCQTSNYRQATFTAGDDDTIGYSVYWMWSGYTGTLSDSSGPRSYGAPQLWIYYPSAPALSNLRFCYAQEAVQIEAGNASATTISDSQLVNCVRGIVLNGPGNSSGSGSGSGGPFLTVNNSLFASVVYPLTVYTPVTGNNLYNCTFANANWLITADASSAGFSFFNSIFANVTNSTVLPGNVLGNYNGFYNSPIFGINPQSDTEWPFAPTSYTDSGGNQLIYIANGQGAYYLREGSPFFNVGLAPISAALQLDLAQRTTIPPDTLMDDIVSSGTIGPSLVRDTDTPDCGYHYPAVDYVIDGVTVNSATLNIDAGTVLAFAAPYYDWGLRVNPGGRLNVNGSPTNRVVFAYLDAVQESPLVAFSATGEMITFAGFEADGLSGPVTPLAEAHIHYADFPTVAGALNAHFGPYNMLWDYTYDLVSAFEVDGCHFQGGLLCYSSSGPQGRTVSIRNSVFERTVLDAEEQWGFVTSFGETLTVANNLFYHAQMALSPASGVNWTFIDNIFDTISFIIDPGSGNPLNGPINVNNNNAYAGMGSNRLSPPAPTSTDPQLSSISYQTGPLGNYYLPSNASALLGTGSRSAASAGEYHFTSLISNAKEAGGQVNIGPAYLALAAGAPVDSDGDGIPDFIEDSNGNGIADPYESNWTVANSGTPAIVSPANNATVSGILAINVSPGLNPSILNSIDVWVDGNSIPGILPLGVPVQSTGRIEIDTRYLANGTHTIMARCNSALSFAGTATGGSTYESTPVTISVDNPISYSSWQGIVQALVNVQAQFASPVPSYTIYSFDSNLPKESNPGALYTGSSPKRVGDFWGGTRM